MTQQLTFPGMATILKFRARHKRKQQPRAAGGHAAPVAVFPIPRRVPFIQEIARRFFDPDLSDDAREEFWATTCMALARDLRRAGQPEAVIAGQLYVLQQAVQRALDRGDDGGGREVRR